MADEHERADEPKEEREDVIGDLEPPDEEAEDVKGGAQGVAFPRKD